MIGVDHPEVIGDISQLGLKRIGNLEPTIGVAF